MDDANPSPPVSLRFELRFERYGRFREGYQSTRKNIGKERGKEAKKRGVQHEDFPGGHPS